MDPQTLPQQTVSGISGGGEISLYQYFVASPLFAGFKDAEGSDRKIFLGQYASFSPALKNFLASTETAEAIQATASTYDLDDGQIYQIAVALRELITGKIFIKELPITISSRLGIDDIKAGEIVNKIISQLFGPIIEDVKRIQRSKFPDKISQIQKESQPAGLTQPTARPLPPGSRSSEPLRGKATKGSPSELSLPGKPPEVQIPRPEVPPQGPQAMRPPLQMPPPIKTEVGPPKEDRPQRPPAPKLEFKVPDLSGIRVAPSTPSGQAGESLEKELEKVASIIDLRSGPKKSE